MKKTIKVSSVLKKIISLTLVTCTIISVLSFAVSAQTAELDFATLNTGTASSFGYQSFDFVDSNGDKYEITTNPAYPGKPVNPLSGTSSLPESYDARNSNYVTSVKNQGNSGNCWSFSAMSALESSSIVQGFCNNSIDYSEAHHIWFNEMLLTADTSDLTYGDGYNSSTPYQAGGNWITAIRSLSKWSGIANESDFPFYPYNLSLMGNYDESERYNQNGGAVIKSAEKLLNDADIKLWIMENGSATAVFHYNDKYLYNNEAYYCYDKDVTINHQITVVGWDDTYSFSEFNPAGQPSASGAWLCKNSWGTSWGDGGYFWISYMDKSLNSFVGFSSQPSEKYNKNYTYNGAGWNAIIDNNGSASVANVFKTGETEETLSAVSSYLLTAGQKLNISIYTDLVSDYSNPAAGTLALEYTTMVAREGYHTIELPEEITLVPDSYFSVVIELVNNNGISYVPVEVDGISEISYSSRRGQSFVYLPQYYSSWKDIKNINLADGSVLNNVCVQAFTNCNTPSTEPTPDNTTEENKLTNGEIIEFGSYPKSKVTDARTVNALNALPFTWTYYNYYAGTDYDHPNASSIGSMKQTNIMKYADVEYNGEKYRAVYYVKYRPNNTLLVTSDSNSFIDNYGYSLNTVYWFKYEPVTWTVLDAENGIIVSEKSIDAQPFNNNQYLISNIYYSDKTNMYYADSYEHSSLRIWLNETLLNTAFTENELSCIEKHNGDYVGLLSVTDLTNPEFGFSSVLTEKDTARRANGTPYASSQGLTSQQYGTNWITGTAGDSSYNHGAIAGVNHAGNIFLNFTTASCTMGVRPVIKLKTSNENPSEITYTLTVEANGGTFPAGTESIIYEYKAGETVEEIPEPTRKGYFFKGWSNDVPSLMPKNNVVLRAVWKAKVYYAYFLANGGKFSNGSTQRTVEAVFGQKIQPPAPPAKEGYTFGGWSPEVGILDTESNKTFRAIWIPADYSAVFDANGGVWPDGSTEKSVTTNYGSKIESPEPPVRQGYIFSCWSPEVGIMDDINGKRFAAQWTPSADTRYTVETYVMNTFGEYEKTSQTFSGITDEKATANYSVPTGFALNTEKSALSGFISPDNSLVLRVYIDRCSYTLTAVIGNTQNKTEYLYGATVTTPQAPSVAGYKFIEWSGNIPGTMPAENITITAVFEKCYVCPDCGNEILGEEAIAAHKEAQATSGLTVRIQNNTGSKTINYGETLRLTAITKTMPADIKIYWYVDGVKRGEGKTFNLNIESGTCSVTVMLVDSKGKVLRNANGYTIRDSERITVKEDFFQKIISFIKNLLGINRTVIQTVFKSAN